jgi:hypothetical protein
VQLNKRPCQRMWSNNNIPMRQSSVLVTGGYFVYGGVVERRHDCALPAPRFLDSGHGVSDLAEQV